MTQIQLGLIGDGGRMGSALKAHLASEPDITLRSTLELDGDVGQFIAAQPDVVVDLGLGAGVDAHGPAIAVAGLPYIVGATGYEASTLERLRQAAKLSGAPVLIVPNFSIGANLMLHFAATAARFMQAPVITERHHTGKADAPSGTARHTAVQIAAAQAAAGAAAAAGSVAGPYTEQVAHVLGGVEAGVPIHSLRGAGYLAEQEVRLCLPGEVLCVEHRSIDRRCFMPGIVYAIRNIGKVQGLQIGLDTILEL